MRILYFGIYDPNYSRNRVLIRGLKLNGVTVDELRARPLDRLWWCKLGFRGFKYIFKQYDYVFVGFSGQEAMILARLLFPFSNIIFDAFTSHYGGYILDREYFNKNSLRARYYRFIDWLSCFLADKVLLDTDAHIRFFVREFGLNLKKFIRVFVGTDESVMKPSENPSPHNVFTVHFHGSFIPLQGVDIILQTAKILKNENILFKIIGKGPMYPKVEEYIIKNDLKNVILEGKVPYTNLPTKISDTDVCLGIFGKSPKTQIVIPNKVYEAIAVGRPVITADTPAIRELFDGGNNILLCDVADPSSLAEKIRLIMNDDNLRRRIAKNGYDLFQNKLRSDIIAKDLLDVLQNNFKK